MKHGDAFDALSVLDPGMAREPWVRLAFAAKDAGITEDEWLTWCAGGGNFDRADAIATYRNAKPKAGGVTAATLYMMARDAGYKPEANASGNGQDNAQTSVAVRAAPALVKVAETPPTDPAPVWAACRPVDVHGYLSRKQIKPHGARVSTAGALVVPFWNRERTLQTVQTISPEGTKRFLAGAKQRGSVAILGEPAGAAVVIVAEGFATAAAIEEATGFPVLAAGSRVSFPEGAKIARHFSPHARVVIAADRGDLSTPLAAARSVAGFLALPGGDDSADGFDFADWRLAGASDIEIRARLDHAPPVPVGDDETPPKAAAARVVKAPARNPPAEVGAYFTDDKGRIVANLSNVVEYLAAGSLGEFKQDTFTGLVTWRGEPLAEVTPVSVTCELQGALIAGRRPFLRVPITTVCDAILKAAAVNSFNSCVQWLDALPAWDGVERLPRFFSDVCDIEATDYVQGVGRYFWLGMVARMVNPGVQVDSAVTLVGPQGIGKSSLARIVGGERYGEVGLAHIGERDWCAQLRGKIVVEISELSGHTRAEMELVKAVLTRTTDEYRTPYARLATAVPRGCVFLATTNERDFLQDPSGNRRWLPVQCKAPFLLEQLRVMRGQYFAEAYTHVRAGLPPLWHVIPHAVDVQLDHTARDPWIDALDEALRDDSGALPYQIANTAIYTALKVPAERQSGGTGRRVSAVMRALGYARARWWIEGAPGRYMRGFQLATEPTDR